MNSRHVLFLVFICVRLFQFCQSHVTDGLLETLLVRYGFCNIHLWRSFIFASVSNDLVFLHRTATSDKRNAHAPYKLSAVAVVPSEGYQWQT